MENDDWTPDDVEKLKHLFDELDKIRDKTMPEELREHVRAHPIFYRLDENKNPVPCSSFEFAMQHEDFETHKRVALTKLGPYAVSTVFLSIDHSFGGSGKPVLFETMIWSDKTGAQIFFNYQSRYCTWDEAKEGHDVIVQLVEKGILP